MSRYDSSKIAVGKETISLSGAQANWIGTMRKVSCFGDTRSHTREKTLKRSLKPKLVRFCPWRVGFLVNPEEQENEDPGLHKPANRCSYVLGRVRMGNEEELWFLLLSWPMGVFTPMHWCGFSQGTEELLSGKRLHSCHRLVPHPSVNCPHSIPGWQWSKSWTDKCQRMKMQLYWAWSHSHQGNIFLLSS